MSNPGINITRVAATRTFLKSFIFPNPLKMPSKTNANAQKTKHSHRACFRGHEARMSWRNTSLPPTKCIEAIVLSLPWRWWLACQPSHSSVLPTSACSTGSRARPRPPSCARCRARRGPCSSSLPRSMIPSQFLILPCTGTGTHTVMSIPHE